MRESSELGGGAAGQADTLLLLGHHFVRPLVVVEASAVPLHLAALVVHRVGAKMAHRRRERLPARVLPVRDEFCPV